MTKAPPLVKPFLKWAGGKSQLLNDLQMRYPMNFVPSIKRYCEPFVGGGAVLFDILSKYEMDEVLINDINSELINTYIQVRDNIDGLIENLQHMQDKYWPMDKQKREAYYYEKRNLFNSLKLHESSKTDLIKASLFIFLNRTCFNGLYRVNRKGIFNVPIGAYNKPLICDAENLINISKVLQNVTIVCGDYRDSEDFINSNTFVYFDPPYRPLNVTSSFTAYSKNGFSDLEQRELAEFMKKIGQKGAKVILSNSDPKNNNSEDSFFEQLYADHFVNRISAVRAINSKGERRGKISELLITNFEIPEIASV